MNNQTNVAQRPKLSDEAKKTFALTEFSKVDTNGSGDIDPEEFLIYLKAKVRVD